MGGRLPRAEAWTRSPRGARVPAGQRLYAIGDVHGRLDLLLDLLGRLATEAASTSGMQHTLIFLGDVVDRGPDSRGVLDLLAAGPPPGFGAVSLEGNHEHAMRRFLEDVEIGPEWLSYGGGATLESYAVPVPFSRFDMAQVRAAQAAFRAAIPPPHVAFLDGLRPSLAIGDYLFVHAGVRPGVALDRQDPVDLMWIRREFLTSQADFGAIVVHGHTIVESPEIRPNRIGIDTGAVHTDRLTCLILEDDRMRFLATSRQSE